MVNVLLVHAGCYVETVNHCWLPRSVDKLFVTFL